MDDTVLIEALEVIVWRCLESGWPRDKVEEYVNLALDDWSGDN
jgi:hypothetical protein